MAQGVVVYICRTILLDRYQESLVESRNPLVYEERAKDNKSGNRWRTEWWYTRAYRVRIRIIWLALVITVKCSTHSPPFLRISSISSNSTHIHHGLPQPRVYCELQLRSWPINMLHVASIAFPRGSERRPVQIYHPLRFRHFPNQGFFVPSRPDPSAKPVHSVGFYLVLHRSHRAIEAHRAICCL